MSVKNFDWKIQMWKMDRETIYNEQLNVSILTIVILLYNSQYALNLL